MSEPDHSNPTHPGLGWRQVLEGDTLKEGDVWSSIMGKKWQMTANAGIKARNANYFRYEPVPPLTPEEQAVIDAMRAGRKVTVEEPPIPKMPRRCWVRYFATRVDPWGGAFPDPWGGAFPLSREPVDDTDLVQLIELTPAVIAALAAAGIEYEDSQNQKGAEQ